MATLADLILRHKRRLETVTQVAFCDILCATVSCNPSLISDRKSHNPSLPYTHLFLKHNEATSQQSSKLNHSLYRMYVLKRNSSLNDRILFCSLLHTLPVSRYFLIRRWTVVFRHCLISKRFLENFLTEYKRYDIRIMLYIGSSLFRSEALVKIPR
jgi:hypothetical protein